MSKRGLGINSFARAMQRNKERVKNACFMFQLWIAKEAYEVILINTPILKGDLRGSWTITQGEQDRSANRGKTKVRNTGAPLDANEGQYMVQTLNSFNHDRFGETVWLNNAREYVHMIEYDGYSKYKAPAGMARIGVASVVAWAELTKREFVQNYERLGVTR